METVHTEVRTGGLVDKEVEGTEETICKDQTYQYPEVSLARGTRRKLLLHKKMPFPASKHQ